MCVTLILTSVFFSYSCVVVSFTPKEIQYSSAKKSIAKNSSLYNIRKISVFFAVAGVERSCNKKRIHKQQKVNIFSFFWCCHYYKTQQSKKWRDTHAHKPVVFDATREIAKKSDTQKSRSNGRYYTHVHKNISNLVYMFFWWLFVLQKKFTNFNFCSILYEDSLHCKVISKGINLWKVRNYQVSTQIVSS